MASGRRLGSTSSATRELIINAAVEVLQEEGAVRLTAARIAQQAGIKPHMVHYYFRSMDDLVIALVRSYGRLGLKNAARAIASDQPLRALWEVEISFRWNAAATEFGSLGYHRAAIREELKRQIEEIRTLQAEAITRHFQLRGIDSPVPPLALTLILASIARQLLRETEFGVTLGHEETFQVVEEYLGKILESAASGRDGAASGASDPEQSQKAAVRRGAENARRVRATGRGAS
jgi:AcrR family transcriptional regulator